MLDQIALVIHPDRAEAAVCADQAAAFLIRQGISVFYPQRGESASRDRNTVILTFGGDGTLLAGIEFAIAYDAPLLGINLGTVGFLTEGEPNQLFNMINRLIEGNYETEERHLLRVSLQDGSLTFLALNDAVVTRGGFARLIRVETRVNGEYLGTFTADGMIAATPTGSTGYALSAGGPVIAPGVHCMVIAPVCPHSLQRSSFVVPDRSDVRFYLQSQRIQTAELQIDGRSRATLQAGESVHITGDDRTIRLIRMKPYLFFSLTQKKLNEWSGSTEGEETP